MSYFYTGTAHVVQDKMCAKAGCHVLLRDTARVTCDLYCVLVD